MGAQQVLRVAVVALLAVPLWSGAGGAAYGQSAEPIAVVDLRPGHDAARSPTRERFLGELGQIAGLQLTTDQELMRALTAQEQPPAGREARKKASQLMSQLLVMRSRDDCSQIGLLGAEVSALLAGLQAAGRAVDAELELVYGFALVCALRAGDQAVARRAVDLLKRIGVSTPPSGVDPAVWASLAAPAATPGPAVRVHIEGEPPGASVWIDHAEVGGAPIDLELLPGQHLLGVATTDGVSGQWFQVDATAGPTTVNYVVSRRPPGRWAGVRQRVDAWRAGKASANAIALGELMAELGVRFLVVLSEGDRAELWTRPEPAGAARRLRAGFMKAPLPLGDAVLQEVRRLEGGSPEDDVQIVTSPAKKQESRQRWWVYASIIGAVGIGAGLLIANDLADDRQRIELSWP